MSAEVLPFPHSRNLGMVDNVARVMARSGSIDGAERELIVVMEIICDKLELAGVPEGEVERECWRFARAVWLSFQKLEDAEEVTS